MKTNQNGQRFGRLVVVDEAPPHITPSGQAKRRVTCKCDCGELRLVHVSSLRSGNTQSCGCYHKDRATKHGHHGTRTYRIWAGMVQRGTGKKNNGNYKGRGIVVCDRWLSFDNFLHDMGECPENLTLERLDNDKGYTPENCAWRTFKQQQRNKRTNRHIQFDGVTMCLSEACEKYNIQFKTLQGRLDAGWSIDKALLTPTDIERIVIDGKLLSLSEISTKFHIPHNVIRYRVRAKWPTSKLLSPVHKKHPKS